MGPRVRTALYYAACPLTVMLILAWILDLPSQRLEVPLRFDGDALLQSIYPKALMDGEGWGHVTGLSAPFAHNLYLFPLNAHFDFPIFSIGGMLTGEIGISMNVGWFIRLMLTSLVAVWSLRRLGVSAPIAFALGVVFTFLPDALARHVRHPAASPLFIPFMLLMQIGIAKGNFKELPRAMRAVLFVACALLGFSDPYAAYFACYGFAATAVVCVFVRGWKSALVPCSAIVLIVASGILNATPSLLTFAENPAAVNRALDTRTMPQDAERAGLFLRQLVLPVKEHPIPIFRSVSEEMISAYQITQAQANHSIGLTASIGFVCLLTAAVVALVGGSANVPPWVSTLRPAAGLALAYVLLAVAGGFSNYLFLVFSWIREYARVDSYLAFLGIYALGVLLDAGLKRIAPQRPRVNRVVAGLLAASLVVFGVWDQKSIGFESTGATPEYWRAQAPEFDDVRDLVRQIEAALPPKSSIYQFPDRDYWPVGNQTPMYLHLRPYLVSHSLRWSYSPITRTDEAEVWHERLASMPYKARIEAMLEAGFDAVWIDRAYRESAQFEELLMSFPGAQLLESETGRNACIVLLEAKEQVLARLAHGGTVPSLESRIDEAVEPELYPWGAQADFGVLADEYLVELVKGWNWRGAHHAYAAPDLDDASVFRMRVAKPDRPVELRLAGVPLVDERRNPRQEIDVHVNGEFITRWVRTGTNDVLNTVLIPASVFSDDGTLEVALRILTAKSPSDLGQGADPTRAALRVAFVELYLR